MAVPLLLDIHHSGAKATSEFLRSIGAPIVRNENLSSDGQIMERLMSFAYAGSEGLGLVQAGHQNG
jgi:methylmalonyl-CoA mutase cobalamin-binding subunit